MSNTGVRLKLITYPGILFGIRTYKLPFGYIHSIYIPFLEFSISIVNLKKLGSWGEEKEEESES